MKKMIKNFFPLFFTAILVNTAWATNGDNLIAIGPIARSMGGVGIAQPLDAISAVFANPAAMCFGKYCPGSQIDFSGTLFMPEIDAKIINSSGIIQADSEDNVYPIPAIGLSIPASESKRLRFGIAAYGVSGLGVDYRGTSLDNPSFFPSPPLPVSAPLSTGTYTQLQIMKFAPALAYQLSDQLSLGLAFHVSYGSLDLNSGSSSGYAFGVQPGVIYKPLDNLSLGLTYTSAQEVTHENISDFDQDGTPDDLDLESPQQFGFGAAYEFIDAGLILESNVKWLNWSDAEGYSDFDWDDQWVFAIGAQWEPTANLKLRVGYNYAKNPVNEHNNFTGFMPISIQGKVLPRYYYETFRIIGFPAVVEHHFTAGIGYAITDDIFIDLGVMYAPENTITESGTDLFGQPVTLESNLSEISIDFGLTVRF